MEVGYCVLCDKFKKVEELEEATYKDPDTRVADPNKAIKVFVCKNGCE